MKKIFENWNKYLKEQREFWGYNISPEQKVALTLKPITNIRVVKQAEYDLGRNREIISDKSHIHPKPDGLWYACGSGWIDWLEERWKYRGMRVEEGNNYMYELDIDYSKMYRMSGEDIEARHKLQRKYGFEFANSYEDLDTGKGTNEINWAEMQKDGYTGIEICPYATSDEPRHRDMPWFSTWAVAGGCIWDPKAIKGYKLLATQPGTPGKGYMYKRPSRKGEPGYVEIDGRRQSQSILDYPRFPSKQRMPGVNPPPGWEEDEAWGKK